MRRSATADIWVTTPVNTVVSGEISAEYKNLRKITGANIQTDYSELEIAEFGGRIREMLRIRFVKAPDINVGDHIYFTQPKDSSKPGEYEVISVKTGYFSKKLVRNPTIIDIRKVTL